MSILELRDAFPTFGRSIICPFQDFEPFVLSSLTAKIMSNVDMDLPALENCRELRQYELDLLRAMYSSSEILFPSSIDDENQVTELDTRFTLRLVSFFKFYRLSLPLL